MCEAERWAADLVARDNNAFAETLERIAKFYRESKEKETNRNKLCRLPLEELLGRISDNSDQCVILSLGDKAWFDGYCCETKADETLCETCRRCIKQWLEQEV